MNMWKFIHQLQNLINLIKIQNSKFTVTFKVQLTLKTDVDLIQQGLTRYYLKWPELMQGDDHLFRRRRDMEGHYLMPIIIANIVLRIHH